MADSRYTLVFLAALVTAGGATYGVWRTIERTKAESRVQTRPVMIAAQDIPEGGSIERLSVAATESAAA